MTVSATATQSCPLLATHRELAGRRDVRAFALVVITSSALLRPIHADAQTTLWIDALGSTAQPPADVVDRGTRTYGLGGLRFERSTTASYFEGVLQGGTGARRDDGRWANAGVFGMRQWSFGRSTLSMGGEGLLLRYAQPFDYTATIAGVKPRLITGVGAVHLEVFGGASIGRWSATYTTEPVVPGTGSGRDVTANGDLSHVQLGSAAVIGIGDAWLRMALSASRAVNGEANGWYRTAETSLFASRGPYQAQLAAQLQEYNGGYEFGADVTVQRELFGKAQVHASLTRTVRDPQLSTPGHLGFTLGVSIPVFAREGEQSVLTPIAEVVGAAQGGRRVRFTVRAPATTRVQLVGSFTDWQPTAMRKDGERWIAELRVSAGSHQFAFLLDGKTWFVPDDAPGIVDDGFGRRNATLIVS